MSVDERTPTISVVIPVRNSPQLIRTCVKHIRDSNFKDYEIIIVDDASTDKTPGVLEKLGVRMLCLPEQKGPAYARNKGAKIARGEYIFFIDADVRVRDHTLKQVVDSFKNNPKTDALFGSYDLYPSAHNIISQYKNLFHHFVHQESRSEASTFWTGCGAVKRHIFLKMGGFDVGYKRPCIEDIELGARLHKAGYKIFLNKEIQVTHLKRWTFWGMLRADIKDRGIPWTELILREQNIPNDLNLTFFQRISALLAFGIIGAFGMQAVYLKELLLLPLILWPLILLLDHYTIKKRVPTAVRILGILMALGGIFLILYFTKVWLIIALIFLIGIIFLNLHFYSFYVREKYFLFAVLIVPLHIFYYIYSVFSFMIGIIFFVWKNKIRRTSSAINIKVQSEA